MSSFSFIAPKCLKEKPHTTWCWMRGKTIGSGVVHPFSLNGPQDQFSLKVAKSVHMFVLCLFPRCNFVSEWDGDFQSKYSFILLFFFILYLSKNLPQPQASYYQSVFHSRILYSRVSQEFFQTMATPKFSAFGYVKMEFIEQKLS